jgi:hypothetical protein
MVQHLLQIVAEYKERMRAIMPFIYEGSYDRQFMREDGGPNKEFLTFLFCNNDLAITAYTSSIPTRGTTQTPLKPRGML